MVNIQYTEHSMLQLSIISLQAQSLLFPPGIRSDKSLSHIGPESDPWLAQLSAGGC